MKSIRGFLLLALCPTLSLLQPIESRAQSDPATLPNLNLFRQGVVAAIAQQADGKIIVGGFFTAVNGVPINNLVRLNTDGSVDTSWDPEPNGFVTSLAINGNDLFIAGDFSAVDGPERLSLAKVDLTTGAVDPNWNPATTSIYYPGNLIALAVKDSFLYVGSSTTNLGNPGSRLVRLDTSGGGAVDPSWNPNPNSLVSCLAVDGTNLYAGGRFSTIGGASLQNLARVSTDTGLADSTWKPNPSSQVFSLALISGDTNVYVGGSYVSIGGQTRANIARVSKTGSGAADPVWNPGADGVVIAMGFDASSNIFLYGNFDTAGGLLRNNCAKISLAGTGAADPNWNAQFPSPVQFPRPMLVGASGVYTGGFFASVGTNAALAFAKLSLTNGAYDHSFAAQVEEPGWVYAIAQQADGKILFGGEFSFLGTSPRGNVARLNLDGTLDPTWSPNLNGTVFAIAANTTDVFVGGDFTNAGGLPRTNLAKISIAAFGTVDPVWNPNPSPPGNNWITSLSTSGNDLFVGGVFTNVGALSRHSLVKVSTQGSGLLDASWNTPANGEVDCVFTLGGFVYASGDNATLEKYGTAGGDSGWHPHFTNSVYNLAVQDPYVYLNSDYSVIYTVYRVFSTGSGAVDPTWVTVADGPIRSVAVNGTNVYVGGNGFSKIGGQPRLNIARLNSGGGGLAELELDPPADGSVRALFAVPNGVYAGGTYYNIGGVERNGFAFLPEAHAPNFVLTTSSNFFITRNVIDGQEITHFQITDISGGSLFQNDGVTPVSAGDFITVSQGATGLVFAGPPGGTVTAVSSLNPTATGVGTAAATLSLDATQAPAFALSTAYYSTLETSNRIRITVQKWGAASASVDYATSDGTALAYSGPSSTGNYFTTNGTLSFPAGATNLSFDILLTNTASFPGTRTFWITLTNASAGQLLYPANAAVVLYSPTLQPSLSFQPASGLQLAGIPGINYEIDYSTNLTAPNSSWTAFTNLTLTNSTQTISAPTFAPSSSRFFRAVVVQ